jgi:hypothetical protein
VAWKQVDIRIKKFVIITEQLYKKQAEQAKRTASRISESTVISEEDYNSKNASEFMAVVAGKSKNEGLYLPSYYQSNVYIDLTEPEYYAKSFARLLQWIFDVPTPIIKPPLGNRPDFAEPTPQEPINTTPINQDYSVRLKHLTVTNFRRFTEFDLSFEQQLTVLVARNGAGKSSILDAVATALGPFLTRLPKVSGINTKETDFRVQQLSVK